MRTNKNTLIIPELKHLLSLSLYPESHIEQLPNKSNLLQCLLLLPSPR